MSGEKTEKATPKRQKEARKEGQVARTQELGACRPRRAGTGEAVPPAGCGQEVRSEDVRTGTRRTR